MNVYDVPLVVFVDVAGDVVMEYDVAPAAAVHERSTVVCVAPDAVRFVTAGGPAELTYTFA